MLLPWFHLLALTVYLGCLIGLSILVFPDHAAIQGDQDRMERLVRTLKRYNPIQIGALGVLTLTGAFRLTDLKAASRVLFPEVYGATLEMKLVLSFTIILLTTYQCMGVAHRFVKRYEAQEPITAKDVHSLIRRLRWSTMALLCLTLFTILVAIRMRGQ